MFEINFYSVIFNTADSSNIYINQYMFVLKIHILDLMQSKKNFDVLIIVYNRLGQQDFVLKISTAQQS